MPRPRARSIFTPPFHDEVDWKSMTKADAIREASKLLGGERSAIKVVRFLEHHDVTVASPQAVKVLGDMYKKRDNTPDASNLVQAVIAVQRYIAAHGGIKAVAKRLEDAESLLAFAETVGGLDVFHTVIQQLQATG